MGSSNSKHRYKTSPASSGGRSGGRSSRLADDSQHTTLSWREMEGPSFYCNYLGFTPISKPPTSMAVLQTPVRDMYYKYRKSPSTGRSATLRLTQRGVLVILYDDGIVNSEIFFDFNAVVFVEAASFAPVKTSSERKPKAFFLPLEQDVGGKPGGGAGAVLEKHAFLVEKNFHFLVTTSHPPLVVCVVRRPQGVKALDCHVFALDTVENALHISGLIASAQTLPGSGGVAGGRGGASFDKARGGGDVIRTEYGEYSVYRGAQQPPTDTGMGGHGPPRMGPGGSAGGGPPGPPGGRNGYLDAGVPGGIVLTQDNFMSDSSSDHPHHLQHAHQYMQQQQHQHAQHAADIIPRVNYGGNGGGGVTRAPGPQYPAGYHNRPPDVIMHARPMSVDVGGENGFSHIPVHDRSFGSVVTGGGGSSDQGSGVRMRYDEGRGGGNQSRHSGSRGSGSQISPRSPVEYPPGGGGSGGVGGYLPPGARPMFPGAPLPPNESVRPSRYSPPPPTSPRGHSAELMRNSGGGHSQEIFSASNRESREIDEESDPQTMLGGKPVAKVPPHFKAGIKVLPSDFRMVKLKHNPQSEDKRADSMSDDSYDNNKELVDRYREMQASEHYPDVAATAAHMRGGHAVHEDHSRDFRSRWEDDDSTRFGPGQYNNDRGSGYSSGDLVYSQEHRNGGVNPPNTNRYSSPGNFNQDFRSQPARGGSGVGGVKSQSAYSIGGIKGDNSSIADSTGSDPSRLKDQEIANMFSNFRLDGNANNPKNNNDVYHRRKTDLLAPSTDDNGFENGLGYLP